MVSSIDSSDDDRRICGLSTFLEGLQNAGHTAFSSLVKISKHTYSRTFSFEIMLGEGASGSWTLADSARSARAPFHQMYGTEASAMQVMRTLIERACPVWKYANFYFDHGSDSTWISDMLSLVCSSPSLSTIRLLRCAYRYLPILVCENPFLETLILYLRFDVDERKHAEQLALCFSRNSVLKSCTLHANFSTVQMWEVVLKPFLLSSEGQANVALKELVLNSGEGQAAMEAGANLVRGNKTLEKLELRQFGNPPEEIPDLIPQALAANRTLIEFRCSCTLAGLKELGDVLTPDSSGHQANTHVTTLKLFPNVDANALGQLMKELSRLLELNTTLKHVEVDLGTGLWEVRSSHPPPHGATECTQDIVESMLRKELRVNKSLECVVVGSWTLLRADGHGEWQMKYCGPCLLRRSPVARESGDHLEKYAPLCYVVSKYDVKVTMCE